MFRVIIVGVSIYVLSSITPISIAQWQTVDACPLIGSVPACYVVTVCYTAMGVAALFGARRLRWLFYAGVAPVILLALTGTVLELSGRPTCPVSADGTPLCFYSLAVGVGMLIFFGIALQTEKTGAHRRIT